MGRVGYVLYQGRDRIDLLAGPSHIGALSMYTLEIRVVGVLVVGIRGLRCPLLVRHGLAPGIVWVASGGSSGAVSIIRVLVTRLLLLLRTGFFSLWL